MLCSRCKKRAAVVFISSNKNKNSGTEGLCVPCAKEIGINPFDNIMKDFNISEEEMSDMQEQISEIFDGDSDQGDNNDEDEEDIVKGGATTFPFVKNLFSNMLFSNKPNDNDESSENSEKIEKSKKKKKSKRRNLNLYCIDLTAKAKNGQVDRIIGRDKEINRAIQILCRRTKNNPCLIGEPGVGKTAIAEGLACKIANGDVPFKLKKKEIFLLDLTALVAGTQFRGQFENRIKGLIEEVKKEGNIILFIDEVHSLVGAGDSEGSMNAANILKPALSRGEIQVIGATTFAEYRKYIEKDSALERRFQSVKIAESTINETIDILKGIKDYYETHHRVKVSDYIINRLVTLSERYITDRFLPDKAIDLLDESCTHASLENKDLAKYDLENADLQKLKSEEEAILASGEEADYEKLAQIRCNIAKLENEIENLKDTALNKEVTENDIAYVIELWTGIPSSKITEHEFKKLANLEDHLKKKIIGQDKAIKEISAAIRRNRVQISPRRRPASFIFVGPTGVGKTELVKTLATELFDVPDALIKIDMSEYMEKHSAAKIVGSPPGYVGYDEAGQLTEKVRQRPYSVLLFDEIEKAHPDVLNILLQVLDEGKITDSHGRVVNFENTVIVMTSNAGSNKKDGALGFAKTEGDLVKEKTLKALKEFLRPEFMSRIDEIIIFNNLEENDYEKIAKIMLDEYVDILSERNIKFSYDDVALKELAKKSFGGQSGARDLRNLIRKEVEDKISLAIVDNDGFDIGEVKLTANPELNLIVNKK